MFFGIDISKYQSPAVIPGWDFVILNVEDPYIGAKVNTCYDLGTQWHVYKWCYPGVSGFQMFDTTQSIVNRLHRPGTDYPQFFLDYEEGGVQPWQRDQWNQAVINSRHPRKPGFYVYLYLVNAQGLSFRAEEDGWLAYYPGGNDGTYYDAMSNTARAKGAVVHQYTSTNGTLDRNACLDDSWFLHGGAPPEPPVDWDAINKAVAAVHMTHRTGKSS